MKNLTVWLIIGVALSVLTSGASPAGCQSGRRTLPVVQPSWAAEPWTGDAAPYKLIQSRLNKLIATGANMNTLANSYRTLAQKNRFDPQAQFRWAYAERKAVLAAHPFNPAGLVAAEDALYRAINPHVYEYTRLHFLIASEIFPGQELLQVGKRVVHHDPQDEDAKYQLINLLGASPAMPDKRQALLYAEQMTRLKPENADYQANLAGVYMDFWFRTRDPKYGKLAVSQYHKYLALAPPNAEYRKTVARLLTTLQKMGVG